MATLPAYHDARQWLLQNLGISQGSSLGDLEALNAKGEFSASFIVHAAVGTK
jgi:hypothetical protein